MLLHQTPNVHNVSSYLDFPGFIVSLAKDRLQCQIVVTGKQVYQDGTMGESFSQRTKISGRNTKNGKRILQALKVFSVFSQSIFNGPCLISRMFELCRLSTHELGNHVSPCGCYAAPWSVTIRVCRPDAMALLGHTPSRALWCPQFQWKNRQMWSLSINYSQDVCYISPTRRCP